MREISKSVTTSEQENPVQSLLSILQACCNQPTGSLLNTSKRSTEDKSLLLDEIMFDELYVNVSGGVTSPVEPEAVREGGGGTSPVEPEAVREGGGGTSPVEPEAVREGGGGTSPVEPEAVREGGGGTSPVEPVAVREGGGGTSPVEPEAVREGEGVTVAVEPEVVRESRAGRILSLPELVRRSRTAISDQSRLCQLAAEVCENGTSFLTFLEAVNQLTILSRGGDQLALNLLFRCAGSSNQEISRAGISGMQQIIPHLGIAQLSALCCTAGGAAVLERLGPHLSMDVRRDLLQALSERLNSRPTTTCFLAAAELHRQLRTELSPATVITISELTSRDDPAAFEISRQYIAARGERVLPHLHLIPESDRQDMFFRVAIPMLMNASGQPGELSRVWARLLSSLPGAANETERSAQQRQTTERIVTRLEALVDEDPRALRTLAGIVGGALLDTDTSARVAAEQALTRLCGRSSDVRSVVVDQLVACCPTVPRRGELMSLACRLAAPLSEVPSQLLRRLTESLSREMPHSAGGGDGNPGGDRTDTEQAADRDTSEHLQACVRGAFHLMCAGRALNEAAMHHLALAVAADEVSARLISDNSFVAESLSPILGRHLTTALISVLSTGNREERDRVIVALEGLSRFLTDNDFLQMFQAFSPAEALESAGIRLPDAFVQLMPRALSSDNTRVQLSALELLQERWSQVPEAALEELINRCIPLLSSDNQDLATAARRSLLAAAQAHPELPRQWVSRSSSERERLLQELCLQAAISSNFLPADAANARVLLEIANDRSRPADVRNNASVLLLDFIHAANVPEPVRRDALRLLQERCTNAEFITDLVRRSLQQRSFRSLAYLCTQSPDLVANLTRSIIGEAQLAGSTMDMSLPGVRQFFREVGTIVRPTAETIRLIESGVADPRMRAGSIQLLMALSDDTLAQAALLRSARNGHRQAILPALLPGLDIDSSRFSLAVAISAGRTETPSRESVVDTLTTSAREGHVSSVELLIRAAANSGPFGRAALVSLCELATSDHGGASSIGVVAGTAALRLLRSEPSLLAHVRGCACTNERLIPVVVAAAAGINELTMSTDAALRTMTTGARRGEHWAMQFLLDLSRSPALAPRVSSSLISALNNEESAALWSTLVAVCEGSDRPQPEIGWRYRAAASFNRTDSRMLAALTELARSDSRAGETARSLMGDSALTSTAARDVLIAQLRAGGAAGELAFASLLHTMRSSSTGVHLDLLPLVAGAVLRRELPTEQRVNETLRLLADAGRSGDRRALELLTMVATGFYNTENHPAGSRAHGTHLASIEAGRLLRQIITSSDQARRRVNEAAGRVCGLFAERGALIAPTPLHAALFGLPVEVPNRENGSLAADIDGIIPPEPVELLLRGLSGDLPHSNRVRRELPRILQEHCQTLRRPEEMHTFAQQILHALRTFGDRDGRLGQLLAERVLSSPTFRRHESVHGTTLRREAEQVLAQSMERLRREFDRSETTRERRSEILEQFATQLTARQQLSLEEGALGTVFDAQMTQALRRLSPAAQASMLRVLEQLSRCTTAATLRDATAADIIAITLLNQRLSSERELSQQQRDVLRSWTEIWMGRILQHSSDQEVRHLAFGFFVAFGLTQYPGSNNGIRSEHGRLLATISSYAREYARNNPTDHAFIDSASRWLNMGRSLPVEVACRQFGLDLRAPETRRLLERAVARHGSEAVIQGLSRLNEWNSLSPELQAFVMAPDALSRVQLGELTLADGSRLNQFLDRLVPRGGHAHRYQVTDMLNHLAGESGSRDTRMAFILSPDFRRTLEQSQQRLGALIDRIGAGITSQNVALQRAITEIESASQRGPGRLWRDQELFRARHRASFRSLNDTRAWLDQYGTALGTLTRLRSTIGLARSAGTYVEQVVTGRRSEADATALACLREHGALRIQLFSPMLYTQLTPADLSSPEAGSYARSLRSAPRPPMEYSYGREQVLPQALTVFERPEPARVGGRREDALEAIRTDPRIQSIIQRFVGLAPQLSEVESLFEIGAAGSRTPEFIRQLQRRLVAVEGYINELTATDVSQLIAAIDRSLQHIERSAPERTADTDDAQDEDVPLRLRRRGSTAPFESRSASDPNVAELIQLRNMLRAAAQLRQEWNDPESRLREMFRVAGTLSESNFTNWLVQDCGHMATEMAITAALIVLSRGRAGAATGGLASGGAAATTSSAGIFARLRVAAGGAVRLAACMRTADHITRETYDRMIAGRPYGSPILEALSGRRYYLRHGRLSSLSVGESVLEAAGEFAETTGVNLLLMGCGSLVSNLLRRRSSHREALTALEQGLGAVPPEQRSTLLQVGMECRNLFITHLQQSGTEEGLIALGAERNVAALLAGMAVGGLHGYQRHVRLVRGLNGSVRLEHNLNNAAFLAELRRLGLEIVERDGRTILREGTTELLELRRVDSPGEAPSGRLASVEQPRLPSSAPRSERATPLRPFSPSFEHEWPTERVDALRLVLEGIARPSRLSADYISYERASERYQQALTEYTNRIARELGCSIEAASQIARHDARDACRRVLEEADPHGNRHRRPLETLQTGDAIEQAARTRGTPRARLGAALAMLELSGNCLHRAAQPYRAEVERVLNERLRRDGHPPVRVEVDLHYSQGTRASYEARTGTIFITPAALFQSSIPIHEVGHHTQMQLIIAYYAGILRLSGNPNRESLERLAERMSSDLGVRPELGVLRASLQARHGRALTHAEATRAEDLVHSLRENFRTGPDRSNDARSLVSSYADRLRPEASPQEARTATIEIIRMLTGAWSDTCTRELFGSSGVPRELAPIVEAFRQNPMSLSTEQLNTARLALHSAFGQRITEMERLRTEFYSRYREWMHERETHELEIRVYEHMRFPPRHARLRRPPSGGVTDESTPGERLASRPEARRPPQRSDSTWEEDFDIPPPSSRPSGPTRTPEAWRTDPSNTAALALIRSWRVPATVIEALQATLDGMDAGARQNRVIQILAASPEGGRIVSTLLTHFPAQERVRLLNCLAGLDDHGAAQLLATIQSLGSGPTVREFLLAVVALGDGSGRAMGYIASQDVGTIRQLIRLNASERELVLQRLAGNPISEFPRILESIARDQHTALMQALGTLPDSVRGLATRAVVDLPQRERTAFLSAFLRTPENNRSELLRAFVDLPKHEQALFVRTLCDVAAASSGGISAQQLDVLRHEALCSALLAISSASERAQVLRSLIALPFGWNQILSGALTGAAETDRAGVLRLLANGALGNVLPHIDIGDSAHGARILRAITELGSAAQRMFIESLGRLDVPARRTAIYGLAALPGSERLALIERLAGSEPSTRGRLLLDGVDHVGRLQRRLAEMADLSGAQRGQILDCLRGRNWAAARLLELNAGELRRIAALPETQRRQLIEILDSGALTVSCYRRIMDHAPSLMNRLTKAEFETLDPLIRGAGEEWQSRFLTLLASLSRQRSSDLVDALGSIDIGFRTDVARNLTGLPDAARAIFLERLNVLPASDRAVTLERISRLNQNEQADLLTAVGSLPENLRAFAFEFIWLDRSFHRTFSHPELSGPGVRATIARQLAEMPIHQLNTLMRMLTGSMIPLADRANMLRLLSANDAAVLREALSCIAEPSVVSTACRMLHSVRPDQRQHLCAELTRLGDPFRQGGALSILAQQNPIELQRLLNTPAALRSALESAPREGTTRDWPFACPEDWRIAALEGRIDAPPPGRSPERWRAEMDRDLSRRLLDYARRTGILSTLFSDPAVAEEALRLCVARLDSGHGAFRSDTGSISVAPHASALRTLRHELRHFADCLRLTAAAEVDPQLLRRVALAQILAQVGEGHSRLGGHQSVLSDRGKTLMRQAITEVMEAGWPMSSSDLRALLMRGDRQYSELLREAAFSGLPDSQRIDALEVQLRRECQTCHGMTLGQTFGAGALQTNPYLRALLRAERERIEHWTRETGRPAEEHPEVAQVVRGLVDSYMGLHQSSTYSYGSLLEIRARRAEYAEALRHVRRVNMERGLSGPALTHAVREQSRILRSLIEHENALERLYRSTLTPITHPGHISADQRLLYEMALFNGVLHPTAIVEVLELNAANRARFDTLLRGVADLGTRSPDRSRRLNDLVQQLTEMVRQQRETNEP